MFKKNNNNGDDKRNNTFFSFNKAKAILVYSTKKKIIHIKVIVSHRSSYICHRHDILNLYCTLINRKPA